MIEIHKIENNYIQLELLNLGCTIYSLKRFVNNEWVDLTRQFQDISDYQDNSYYLNAIVGPHAGRLKQGKFEYNHEVIQLDVNDSPNQLHGGIKGLSFQLFNINKMSDSIVRAQLNHDGISYLIEYKLDSETLSIDMHAFPNQPRLINMTQHTYFNLGMSKTIAEHLLKINSQKVLSLDRTSVPTNDNIFTKNSVFDFNNSSVIGNHLNQEHSQFNITRHIDHPFKINKYPITLSSPNKVIEIDISSTENFAIIYLANFFDKQYKFKKYGDANNHEMIAIEPQALPNGINLGYDQIYTPDKPYHHRIQYKIRTNS